MKVLSNIKGVTIRHHTDHGETRLAQHMQCSRCDAEEVFSNNKGAAYPQEALFKFARHKGWEPSAKGKHLCPSCMEAAMAKDEPESPREMSPKERRQIFREIDDSYDEGGSRYCDNITDDTIARKLGVPRKWVSDIREENFGPSGENVEMQRLASNLGRLASQVTDAINRCLEAASEAEKLKTEIDKARDDLDRIKGAVGPVRRVS